MPVPNQDWITKTSGQHLLLLCVFCKRTDGRGQNNESLFLRGIRSSFDIKVDTIQDSISERSGIASTTEEKIPNSIRKFFGFLITLNYRICSGAA
jgi:hypothetical protein